jgi:hypothetical protein
LRAALGLAYARRRVIEALISDPDPCGDWEDESIPVPRTVERIKCEDGEINQRFFPMWRKASLREASPRRADEKLTFLLCRDNGGDSFTPRYRTRVPFLRMLRGLFLGFLRIHILFPAAERSVYGVSLMDKLAPEPASI